jgi:hypothetical protein
MRLDNIRPIARNTDNRASHMAQARHMSKHATRCWQVLELVSKYPCSTSGELSRKMLINYPELPLRIAVTTPNKRLSDLEEMGYVMKQGTLRTCVDSNYKANQWLITEYGKRELETRHDKVL